MIINGNTVDNFSVTEGFLGTVSLAQSFAPIAGPNYTVEIRMTNEVAGGQGSHTLRYAGDGFHHLDLSGDDCIAQILLSTDQVAAGADLGMHIEVQHNGRRAVTSYWNVWIEAADGSMVAMRRLRETTFNPGETVTRDVQIQVPGDLPAGRYWVRVGLDRMKQGSAITGRPFDVKQESGRFVASAGG